MYVPSGGVQPAPLEPLELLDPLDPPDPLDPLLDPVAPLLEPLELPAPPLLEPLELEELLDPGDDEELHAVAVGTTDAATRERTRRNGREATLDIGDRISRVEAPAGAHAAIRHGARGRDEGPAHCTFEYDANGLQEGFAAMYGSSPRTS